MGSSPRATSLKVVSNVSLLVTSVDRHVVSFTLFTTNLNVDVTEVIKRKRFTFGSAETSFALFADLIEAFTKLLRLLGFFFVVKTSEEAIVLSVGMELERVLVKGEKSVVAIS